MDASVHWFLNLKPWQHPSQKRRSAFWSTSTDPKLVYPRLPRRHIRLLQLNGYAPVREIDGITEGGVLEATLTLIPLSYVKRGYDFVALSYVWGSGTSTKLETDDRMYLTTLDPSTGEYRARMEVSITPNLHGALRHLLKIRNQLPKYLWVDSLCIDQSNKTEKAAQIGLMTEIYSEAKLVISWLGSGDDDDATRMRDLWRELGYFASLRFVQVRPLAVRLRSLWSDCFLKMQASGYFTRAWTYQEVVLARKIVLMYGRHQIDFDHFASLVGPLGIGDSIEKRRLWYKLFGGLELLASEIGRIDTVRSKLQNTTHSPHRHQRLIDALLSIWGRNSTDARDKVFAVLGLTNADELIKPDYRLTTKDVLVRAAQACIRQDQNLDILRYCGLDRLKAGRFGLENERIRRVVVTPRSNIAGMSLPSWIPDWTAVVDNLSVDILRERNAMTVAINEIDTELPFWFSDETLIATGIALGCLRGKGEYFRVQAFPENAIPRGRDGVQWSEAHDPPRPVGSDIDALLSNLDPPDVPNPADLNIPSATVPETPVFEVYLRARTGDWAVLLHGCPFVIVLRPVDTKRRGFGRAGEPYPSRYMFKFLGTLPGSSLHDVIQDLKRTNFQYWTPVERWSAGVSCIYGSFGIN